MKQAQDLGYKSEARRGLLFVFMAGVLWSTVGLGIRMIDEATVWQILLYRSISLSLFLAIVIYQRKLLQQPPPFQSKLMQTRLIVMMEG